MSLFTRLRDLATAPVRAVVNPLGNVAGQAQIVARENPEIVPAATSVAGSLANPLGPMVGQAQLLARNLLPQPGQPSAPASAAPATSEEQRQLVLSALPRVELERLGGAEEQAQRAQLARELMAQQQSGQRQLLSQQAKQGVRGGAAAAQQSRLQQQIAAQRAAQEEQGFLGRRMFNIEQAQKEKFAEVSSELARRQLAAALLGQEAQVRASERFGQQQIAAAQAANQGGFLSDFLRGLGV